MTSQAAYNGSLRDLRSLPLCRLVTFFLKKSRVERKKLFLRLRLLLLQVRTEMAARSGE